MVVNVRRRGAVCWVGPAIAASVLTSCAALVPASEAEARSASKAIFAEVVAANRWDVHAFEGVTLLPTDTGWLAEYPCRADTRGSLVVFIARDGVAKYSLAPPEACRKQLQAASAMRPEGQAKGLAPYDARALPT